jgi:hypothetical protein
MMLPEKSSNEKKISSAYRAWESRFFILVRRSYRTKYWIWVAVLIVSIFYIAVRRNSSPFVMVHADRQIAGTSVYPLATDPNLVGTYSPRTKSGAGYFYDDVLEYRVWLHPDKGAERRNGDEDYFEAFAQYERAEGFSKNATGAEEPLVLVRQLEWINEPEPGHYVPEKQERITEWQVQWLASDKRSANSIQDRHSIELEGVGKLCGMSPRSSESNSPQPFKFR